MKNSRLPRAAFRASLGGSPAAESTPLDSRRPLLFELPPEEPLDLEHTLRCGQVFRWRQQGDTWYGPYGEGALAFRRVPEGVEARALGGTVTAGEAWRFLGLDTSLAEVARRLSGDRWVRRAFELAPGLRIVRQDPWDCVACYVCSQWNNIPKIELSTERLARKWGRVHLWPEGIETASFPAPAALAGRHAEDLRHSALGYRCAYLAATATRVAGGEVALESLRSASYAEALAALLKLPGVGRKVADCILLFCLDKPQACPVDLWVRRVVHELFPRQLAGYLPDAVSRAEKGLTPREYDAILQFAWDRWGMLAGYAQQYLFYVRRTGLIQPGA